MFQFYITLWIGSLQFVEMSGKKHFVNSTLDKISSATAKFRSTFQEHFPKDIIYNIDLLEENSDFENQITGSSKNLVKSYENGICFAKEYIVENISSYNLEVDLKNFTAVQSLFESEKSVDFSNANFIGEKTDFSGTHFGSGNLSFYNSEFGDFPVSFINTSYSEGNSNFQYVKFNNAVTIIPHTFSSREICHLVK